MKKRNAERNKKILKALRSEQVSYAVIAADLGVTRMVVAGVAFRHRHPPKNRSRLGYQAQSYKPLLTAQSLSEQRE